MLIYTSAINFSFINSSHKLPSHGERPEQREAAPSDGGCESFHVWVQSFLEHIRLTFREWCQVHTRHAANGCDRHTPCRNSFGVWSSLSASPERLWKSNKEKQRNRGSFQNKTPWSTLQLHFFVFIYHQYPKRAQEKSKHTCTPMNERLQWETER